MDARILPPLSPKLNSAARERYPATKRADAAENENPSGLSNTHIRPLEDKPELLRGRFTVWEGSTVSELKLKLVTPQARSGGGKRGEIGEFSQASKKRMRRFCRKLNLEVMGMPLFITLTQPGEFVDDPKEWKRYLKNMLKSMLRRWPAAVILWRMELQDRGAPDIHLLIFQGPEVNAVEVTLRESGKKGMVLPTRDPVNKAVMDWVSRRWWEICGKVSDAHRKAGTRVEAIRSANGIIYYVSKYMSKEQKALAKLKPFGRHWGVVGRENITYLKKGVYGTREKAFYQIRRTVARWLEKKIKRKVRIYWRGNGFNLETFESLDLLRLIQFYGAEKLVPALSLEMEGCDGNSDQGEGVSQDSLERFKNVSAGSESLRRWEIECDEGRREPVWEPDGLHPC